MIRSLQPVSSRQTQQSGRVPPVLCTTLVLCSALCFLCASCSSHRQEQIAVIPQTEGLLIWDAVHVGAESSAEQVGASIYWNAPPREDDVESQIVLVDRVIASHYQGLVLAPDQCLALISPVRRALARGIPTVIIGSPLSLPPDHNLVSIVNDDELGGRLAAQRAAALLHGHGSVALLGINPDIQGIMTRAHAFEEEMDRAYPGIEIVERRAGSFNVPHEQQAAEDALRAHPQIDVIVTLEWAASDGVLRALQVLNSSRTIKLISFDWGGLPPFDQWPQLDTVIQQDSRTMGYRAIEAIDAKIHQRATPSRIALAPKMITRETFNSAEVREFFGIDKQIGNWRWDPIQ